MTVLVAGSYPPAPDSGATLATVRALLRDGRDVCVLAPEPGAAHEHAPLSGLAGAWSLARRARRFDALVVHMDPGLPWRAGTGRGRRAAECLAWSWALARYRDVRVEVGDLRALPGSVGGRAARRMWRAVTHVTVADDGDRRFLHEHAGIALDRISTRAPEVAASTVPSPVSAPSVDPGPPSWRSHAGAVAYDDAIAEIATRAAARRAAGALEPVDTGARAVLAPPPPPGVTGAFARHVAKRALGRHAPAVAARYRRLRHR